MKTFADNDVECVLKETSQQKKKRSRRRRVGYTSIIVLCSITFPHIEI